MLVRENRDLDKSPRVRCIELQDLALPKASPPGGLVMVGATTTDRVAHPQRERESVGGVCG